MSEIDWKVVARHYEAGHSMRECKEKFGFSNYAWDRAIADGRIVPREKPQLRWKDETREAVRQLVDKGMSHSQIAFELGVSKPTVSYHARRLGIQPDERASRRFDWAAIQKAHDSGLSAAECCEKFGCSRSAWHAAAKSGRLKARSTKIPIAELLVAGRPTHRGHLKERLLREGIKGEHCEECGLSEWNGKPLRVALHHINGDGYDNRRVNIIFLCPNCHSQTKNFGGRNGHLRARPEVQ